MTALRSTLSLILVHLLATPLFLAEAAPLLQGNITHIISRTKETTRTTSLLDPSSKHMIRSQYQSESLSHSHTTEELSSLIHSYDNDASSSSLSISTTRPTTPTALVHTNSIESIDILPPTNQYVRGAMEKPFFTLPPVEGTISVDSTLSQQDYYNTVTLIPTELHSYNSVKFNENNEENTPSVVPLSTGIQIATTLVWTSELTPNLSSDIVAVMTREGEITSSSSITGTDGTLQEETKGLTRSTIVDFPTNLYTPSSVEPVSPTEGVTAPLLPLQLSLSTSFASSSSLPLESPTSLGIVSFDTKHSVMPPSQSDHHGVSDVSLPLTTERKTSSYSTQAELKPDVLGTTTAPSVISFTSLLSSSPSSSYSSPYSLLPTLPTQPQLTSKSQAEVLSFITPSSSLPISSSSLSFSSSIIQGTDETSSYLTLTFTSILNSHTFSTSQQASSHFSGLTSISQTGTTSSHINADMRPTETSATTILSYGPSTNNSIATSAILGFTSREETSTQSDKLSSTSEGRGSTTMMSTTQTPVLNTHSAVTLGHSVLTSSSFPSSDVVSPSTSSDKVEPAVETHLSSASSPSSSLSIPTVATVVTPSTYSIPSASSTLSFSFVYSSLASTSFSESMHTMSFPEAPSGTTTGDSGIQFTNSRSTEIASQESRTVTTTVSSSSEISETSLSSSTPDISTNTAESYSYFIPYPSVGNDQSVSTSVLTPISTSTSIDTEASTESSLSNLPKAILGPNKIKEAKGYTLITIGFKESLNYPLVVKTPPLSANIFSSLPSLLNTPFGNIYKDIEVLQLVPLNSVGLFDYTVTVAEVYFPIAEIDTLAQMIKDQSSKLYDSDNANDIELALLINPEIPITGLVPSDVLTSIDPFKNTQSVQAENQNPATTATEPLVSATSTSTVYSPNQANESNNDSKLHSSSSTQSGDIEDSLDGSDSKPNSETRSQRPKYEDFGTLGYNVKPQTFQGSASDHSYKRRVVGIVLGVVLGSGLYVLVIGYLIKRRRDRKRRMNLSDDMFIIDGDDGFSLYSSSYSSTSDSSTFNGRNDNEAVVLEKINSWRSSSSSRSEIRAQTSSPKVSRLNISAPIACKNSLGWNGL